MQKLATRKFHRFLPASSRDARLDARYAPVDVVPFCLLQGGTEQQMQCRGAEPSTSGSWPRRGPKPDIVSATLGAARTQAKARGYFAHHHERLIVTANGSADPVIRPWETKFCGTYIPGDLRSRGVRWDRWVGSRGSAACGDAMG